MGILRTLLALSVVLDHLGGGATNQLVGGRLAVQLFYVISGFLISTYDRHRPLPGRDGALYANRLLRLFPVYLAVAALTLAAHAAGDGSFSVSTTTCPVGPVVPDPVQSFHRGTGLADVLRHRAFLPALYRQFRAQRRAALPGLLVPQAWTLGVEITFYLVAPFVLRSPRRLLALLAASLALRAC